MVKKTPFRLSILAFVTAVVFTPVWAENTGIYLSDLPSRPVSNLDNIPTRQANNYSVTDIQKAKRQLSATEMKDIDSLIKAARDNQNATADRATDTVKDNRKMMGEMPEYKNTDELVDDAVRGALAKSDMTNEKQNKPAGDFIYILVSASLSDAEITDILKLYDGRTDIALVVQGAKDKKNLLDELTHWQKLSFDSKSSLAVNLDPTVFKNYNVSSVPTIIHEKDGELVARVTGIYDIAYLKDKTGDLGVAGPAVGVVEKNLIDELQESVAKLDFDGMKKKAIDNYWPRQVFQEFPEATKRATRTIDPTVIIPQNITSPNGDIVAKRGRFNPLTVMPFTIKLIFFDAREEWQRQFARYQFEHTPASLTPILVTTNVYGDGWQTFRDTKKEYGDFARLYMIQPGMAEHYGLINVPSVVTADSKRFINDEYSRKDFEELK